MFESGFEEGLQSDVPVPDASAEAFGMLLRVVYSGRIDLAADVCTLCELLARLWALEGVRAFGGGPGGNNAKVFFLRVFFAVFMGSSPYFF